MCSNRIITTPLIPCLSNNSSIHSRLFRRSFFLIHVGFLFVVVSLYKPPQVQSLQVVRRIPYHTYTRSSTPHRHVFDSSSWRRDTPSSSYPPRLDHASPSALSLIPTDTAWTLWNADSSNLIITTLQYTLQPLWNFLASTATHFFSSSTDAITNLATVTEPTRVIPPSLEDLATSEVLDTMGKDLLLFFVATVIVVPLFSYLKLSPILGYLLAGAIMGSHGLNLFQNSRADIEMGDFGILFLLFYEGLEISSPRLKKLISYLPLGLAQMTLTAGVVSAAILLGGPDFLGKVLPLDSSLIEHIKETPVEVLVLALAGTLSTSAFVFPVLKEKEWEVEASGEAATSILLLQDLAVAPLLVLLPYMAALGGVTEATAAGAAADGMAAISTTDIGVLTLKATLGFGSVIAVGSFVLRRIFRLVAEAKSSETFVALCLLVAAGMGAIAKTLGLTDTAGAFAAGVLLANTNYRAQIQADILPFKGILLGIFFMDAGGSFDFDLVLREFPTVLTGAFSLIVIKAATLWAATKAPEWLEPNRLPNADAIKLSLLLAGGGEFALVVLALAEKVHIIPSIENLEGILTAIVLATMAVTPLLAEMADRLSSSMKTDVTVVKGSKVTPNILEECSISEVACDAIVVCGYDERGQILLKELGRFNGRTNSGMMNQYHPPHIVAFDNDPSHSDLALFPSPNTCVLFGDGGNPQVLRSMGIVHPSAIIVSYDDHHKAYSATARLREAFLDSPIYALADTRIEAQHLRAAGASEVLVETDEFSRSALALLLKEGILPSENGVRKSQLEIERFESLTPDSSDRYRYDAYNMVEWFEFLDVEGKGYIDSNDLAHILRKTHDGIMSDDEIEQLDLWLQKSLKGQLHCADFCTLISEAPAYVKDALCAACLVLTESSSSFNHRRI